MPYNTIKGRICQKRSKSQLCFIASQITLPFIFTVQKYEELFKSFIYPLNNVNISHMYGTKY